MNWLRSRSRCSRPSRPCLAVERLEDRLTPAAPNANDDVFILDEDSGQTTLNVKANDSVGTPGIPPINVISVSPAAFGTVILDSGLVLYTPAPGFTGLDVFTYVLQDATPGNTDTATVLVALTAVNDAPTLQVPGPQIYTANTSLAIGGIGVFDVDANQGDSLMEVTVSAAHGTLTLGSLGGLDFGYVGAVGDGIADATMTFRGALASVNVALGGLVYTPNANFGGDDTIDIDVNDQGNFGSGGIKSDSASINLEHAANVLRLQPSVTKPGKTDLLISGNSAGNMINVKRTGTSPTKLTVTVDFVVQGKNFKPTGNILIYGLDNNDNVSIQSKITKPAFLDGGDGNDTLVGGKAADILLGGLGNDNLSDAAGRNIFIGGDGTDIVVGTKDQEIVIGGTTAHDDDGLALDAILKEWTSNGAFALRVGHLRGTSPGLNGSTTLTVATVFNDGVADSLTGAIGLDYYWLFALDTSDLIPSLELQN